jgi:hypothetical protein
MKYPNIYTKSMQFHHQRFIYQQINIPKHITTTEAQILSINLQFKTLISFQNPNLSNHQNKTTTNMLNPISEL